MGELVAALGGGLVAALITAGLSLWAVKLNLEHSRESERKADERRLRDQRGARLRTSIETVLKASLTVGQVVKDEQRLWQNETQEARDLRHEAMLEASSIGLNEARVSLMLQDVTKELMGIVDETIMSAFEAWKSASSFKRTHPDADVRELHDELETEWKRLQGGIEKLRAEGRRVLDAMEGPI